MRVFPIVLTVLVAALLYAWVIERDWLYARLGIGADPEAAAAADDRPAEAAPAPRDDAALIRVSVVRSSAEEVDSAVVLRGRTEALRQVDVRSETSSTVISDPIRKGAFVEAGQELCVLAPGTRPAALAEARARVSEAQARKAEAEARVVEARTRIPEASARVAEAEARLEEALSNENAAVRLSEDGFASDTRVKNARAAVASARAALAAAEAGVEAASSGLSGTASGIESAEAGIESAEAGIAAAETEIERLTIRAPFAGLLESDTAELGELLQPGNLCATIIQLDPIKLVAFVPETSVDRIDVGAGAVARLASAPSQQVQGAVTFLSRSADPETNTFRVEVEVPNPDLSMRDGQTAEILISAEGARAHMLPSSALTLNDAGTLGVRIVEAEDMVAFAPVTLIRDTPDGVWLGGLPDIVDVIVVGQEFVTEGVRVTPVFREQDA